MVCYFSSYINCTAFRRVNSLLYSWSHVIYWRNSCFFFKVKQQEKDYCCLFALESENKWLFPILYCVLCQIENFFQEFFLNKQSKTQIESKNCEILKTRSSGGERLKNFQKQGDYSHSRGGEEKWAKMGRSPSSDEERRQVCRIVRCDGFSLS